MPIRFGFAVGSAGAVILALAACRSTSGHEADAMSRIEVSGTRHEVLPEARPLLVASGRETRVKAGHYLRPALGDGGARGVIAMEGAHDVDLDLTGVTLIGTRSGSDLD